jgi:hypothetical protein
VGHSEVQIGEQPMASANAEAEVRTVSGSVNYIGPMSERPRFHANDHSRDNLNLESHIIRISDARTASVAPSLDREGFELVRHRSAVRDFRDQDEVGRIHRGEIVTLLRDLAGADEVIVSAPGVLRFSERSTASGSLDNSYPARFVHIDVSDSTALDMATRACPRPMSEVRRYAHYNVWRVFSPPPQDVPLTVCDARSLRPQDLVPADAVFDVKDGPEWSFEGLLVRYDPGHRWSYYSDMDVEDTLVFKTSDSDPDRPHNVPHSGFDDPTCREDAAPRSSIEMRGIAFWYR